MPRPKENLKKVTIRLHDGDTEILEKFYPSVGYNAAIRKLVRKHCRALEEHSSQKESELSTNLDINLD